MNILAMNLEVAPIVDKIRENSQDGLGTYMEDQNRQL